jgi:HSP20 family protein
VTVTLELPGVAKDGVEVKIDGNELSIVGRRQAPAAEGTYLLRERRRGDFRKVFTIDDTISRDKVDAALADGVLTLTLHLKEAAKPRRIEIA